MKPSMLLAVMLVTVRPRAQAEIRQPLSRLRLSRFGPTTQSTSRFNRQVPWQSPWRLLQLLTVNQPTTFVASTSSSANATLDFGDGNQVAFDVEKSATLKHVYNRSGTFVAVTFTATNTAGDSASIRTTLVMR